MDNEWKITKISTTVVDKQSDPKQHQQDMKDQS